MRGTRQKQRQGKAYRTCDQDRTKRILLYLFRESFGAVTEGLATILIDLLSEACCGITDFACGILCLAVELLGCSCRPPGAPFCLGIPITGQIADRAFDLSGNILGGA